MKMTLEVLPAIRALLPPEAGFDWFMQREGIEYRSMRDRSTLRFELAGNSYFIKIHRGVGWREILKNLLFLRLPVIGASNEYSAIRLLQRLGIQTMTWVAFGKRGLNPARQQSFIMTEDLQQTTSLEDMAESWQQSPPGYALKRALIRRVAAMTSGMHAAGMNHRDLYICHFLYRPGSGKTPGFELFLIDLHRAQIRSRIPYRWRLKDVASLYFSSMDAGLSRTDRFRFIREYTGQSPRQVLKQDAVFWKQVEKRAMALYASYPGRE